MIKRISKILFVCSLFFCLNIFLGLVVSANTSIPQIENPFDDLQVKIPGMERFNDAVVIANNDGKYTLSIGWIGEYVKGIYQYGIMIIGIFAAVTFIIGAVIWIAAAGNPSRIGEAKSWMTSSILGLVLALSSYLLLYTINPELLILKPINLGYIERIEDPGDYESGYSYSGQSGVPYTTKKGNLPCPSATNINEYVKYLFTKNPPFIYEASERRANCYGNNCYLDCSSLTLHMAQCLHLNSINGEGTTKNLFIDKKNNRKVITDFNRSPDDYLKPGDLIGHNDGSNPGHVLIYIGGNELLECGGEVNDGILKQSGCIKITNFKKRISRYKDKTLYYINR
ncbi:MAG: NlpC/P60 family protein [bacterium]